jgi:L-ascorbate metabolism protein UlaG (beta-lactamase superfamily)
LAPLAFVWWVLRPIALEPSAPAGTEGPWRLRYLGISGYELHIGDATLLLDPVYTRPSVLGLLTGPIGSGELPTSLPRADYILVNHAHYDHVIDSAAIALRTGAVVVGSRSVCNFARSRGVPEAQVREVRAGEHHTLVGVEFRAAHHTAVAGVAAPLHGTIAADAGRLWFWQYRMDAVLSFRIHHGDRALWFQPSGLTSETALDAPADTLIVGLSGAPIDATAAAAALQESGALRVLPTHFDNFFLPRARGLTRLSFVDMEAARRHFAGASWWVLGMDQEVRL